MKIAIVDNYTDCLPQVEQLCKNLDADTALFRPHKIGNISPSQFDLAVLSGGIWYDDTSQQYAHYGRELSFILHSGLPVIGICLGMLLMAAAFGGHIEDLSHRSIGPKDIYLNQKGTSQLPNTPPKISVFENHSKSSIALPGNLELWAESEEGAEIISHTKLPLVGVQFHPEQKTDTAAEQIWLDLINNVTNRSNR